MLKYTKVTGSCDCQCNNYRRLGCGGGLVVSVLAFYSDDPSSIPAEVYNIFCKIVVEKNENKQKEAGFGPIFKTITGGRHSSVALSAPTILQPRVRIPSTPSTLFSIVLLKLMRKERKYTKKRLGWPIKKNYGKIIHYIISFVVHCKTFFTKMNWWLCKLCRESIGNNTSTFVSDLPQAVIKTL